MPALSQQKISEKEYLRIEPNAPFRSEYFAGEIFAMAGANRQHNRIVTNVVTGLDTQLKERPCNVYATDMRVKIEVTGLYTYPDVVVTCGKERFEDHRLTTLLNPLVIIEVLSDSTEAYDRGQKFEHYRQLATLMEYVLISQTAWRVEHFLRQPDERWLYTDIHKTDGIVIFPALDCQLTLQTIYTKVEMPPARPLRLVVREEQAMYEE